MNKGTVLDLLKLSELHELGYCWMCKDERYCEDNLSYSYQNGMDIMEMEYQLIKDHLADTETVLQRLLELMED